VCTYSTMEEFNTGNYDRYYNISYIGNTNNYAVKDLSFLNDLYFLENSEWTFDTKMRPYFGEAIENIQLLMLQMEQEWTGKLHRILITL